MVDLVHLEANAMNGSFETVDDRPALLFERHFDHSVDRVWRALTEPDELSRWFVAPIEWGPEVGERFESYGQSGEVTELDPPHVLGYAWGGERFRFELRPEGHGSLLDFTHVFDERALGAQHAAGWETYFKRLDAHLAGDFLSAEEAHEGVAEIHERYAGRFGLDPEVGRRQFVEQQQR
jgi:uncharacterized protein YndB with AHSA1/START domain